MDQTALTTTLRELAADAALHTAPAADARRRAARLQRRRRTGAVGLAAVVALGAGSLFWRTSDHGGGATPAASRLQWQQQLNDPTDPNKATTSALIVADAATGKSNTVAYWHEQRLCVGNLQGAHLSTSSCSGVNPATSRPLTVAALGRPEVWASVRADVASVRASQPDGTSTTLTPFSATGFPYRVVMSVAKVMGLHAIDKDGNQIGATVAGPDALQMRQVMYEGTCSAINLGNPENPVFKNLSGADCYQLSEPHMTLVPKDAVASYDPTQGYIVTVDLTEPDRVTFGRLTQMATVQTAPHNQLAMVLDGKVLSAPTIQEAILGGVFQISAGSDPAWTQAYADQLAAQLRG
ncbi:hypothetical protein acdb102_04110 [Acidothermaceae bacterium B102]|nr:hypothetical protein acdb102_04110 [Acidothermaceae bacterium B102]